MDEKLSNLELCELINAWRGLSKLIDDGILAKNNLGNNRLSAEGKSFGGLGEHSSGVTAIALRGSNAEVLADIILERIGITPAKPYLYKTRTFREGGEWEYVGIKEAKR